MLNHKKSCIITALLCIIMAFAASPVFADGGNGTGSGDGSGNGSTKPDSSRKHTAPHSL